MPGSEISSLSAVALVRAYQDRTLSPVEVARDALARIERHDQRVNAFAWVDSDTTLAMARVSERRWIEGRPLGPGDGVPATIKDLMDVQGWPTRRGSLTTEADRFADTDSPCVARLREAGAVFLGKTTVPEFGWKAVNDSPLHGATRNPWDTELTSGGSSGGAAVAAALGLGSWHTASDAAGSIRIPAAFCGVFGFKPTHGLVPLFPPSAFSGLGHHGPITRTVADAAVMLTIMVGPDARDAAAVPAPVADFSIGLDDGIAGMRIGYVRRLADVDIDPEIAECIDAAVAVLDGLGARVEETALNLSGAREIIEILWSVGCATLVEAIDEAQRGLVDPGLAAHAARGSRISATAYREALIERELLASQLNLVHRQHDLLVLPVVPILPFAHGHDVPPGSALASWLDWTPLTYPFNLSHQPAASVPCGLTAGGLPTAFQVVGRRFADATVLRAAHAYHSATDGHRERPPVAE